MRGESLTTTQFDFHGIPMDRAFAFVQEGLNSPFPWLTGRQCPEMLQCQPVQVEEGKEWPKFVVQTPDGEQLSVESDELLARLEAWSGRRARFHADYRGAQDVAYASVISTATVRALAEAAGVPEDHRRFRMNLVVDVGNEPFAERNWVGKQVSIGGVTLAIHEQDQRCRMITLHPETGESAPAVLKKAGELNDACAGVYGSILVPGTVAIGDAVVLQ